MRAWKRQHAYLNNEAVLPAARKARDRGWYQCRACYLLVGQPPKAALAALKPPSVQIPGVLQNTDQPTASETWLPRASRRMVAALVGFRGSITQAAASTSSRLSHSHW